MPRVSPTERDEQEVSDLLATLPTGLRHLLLTKFQVPAAWAAELAHEGYTSEELWAQMGSTRDEINATLVLILDYDQSTKEGKKLEIQLLAVQGACTKRAEDDSQREADSKAQGTVLKMDTTAWAACFEKLQKKIPRHAHAA